MAGLNTTRTHTSHTESARFHTLVNQSGQFHLSPSGHLYHHTPLALYHLQFNSSTALVNGNMAAALAAPKILPFAGGAAAMSILSNGLGKYVKQVWDSRYFTILVDGASSSLVYQQLITYIISLPFVRKVINAFTVELEGQDFRSDQRANTRIKSGIAPGEWNVDIRIRRDEVYGPPFTLWFSVELPSKSLGCPWRRVCSACKS